MRIKFDGFQDDSAKFRERFEKYPYVVDEFLEFVNVMKVHVSLQSVADYLKLIHENKPGVNMTYKGIDLRFRNFQKIHL